MCWKIISILIGIQTGSQTRKIIFFFASCEDMVNSGVCFTLAPLRPFFALLRHFPQKREPLSQTLSNYAFKSGTSFQYQRLITMGVIKACSIKNTNFAWLEGQHRYSAMFWGVYTFKTCFY